jgi:hypothetical protein
MLPTLRIREIVSSGMPTLGYSNVACGVVIVIIVSIETSAYHHDVFIKTDFAWSAAAELVLFRHQGQILQKIGGG